MNFKTTLILLGLFGVLAIFSYFRHTRPHNEIEPRMIPWAVIALGSVAFFFMLVVHLVNLLGFETGRG